MEELLNSSEKLPAISDSAAKAYDRRKGLLAAHVNRVMEKKKDLSQLIGGFENLEMMFDNHVNHAKIMTTVLYLNSYRLLASLLPWVYQTYNNHGFSYEYFPVELNAWKQSLQKGLPTEYTEEIIPLYDWLIRQHQKLIEISENLNKQRDYNFVTAEAKEFFDSLLGKNLAEAVRIGQSHLKENALPAVFYSRIAEPSLYQIGTLWQKGQINVADEHLATAITQNVVAELQVSGVKSSNNKGRAVISAAVGELHDLGGRMLAHCFENDGWKVDFLGANTPLIDLVEFCKEAKPDFIALSVAMPFHIHHIKLLVDKLKTVPELKDIPVMAGGSVFKMLPEAKNCIKSAQVIMGIDEALDWANGWVSGKR